MLLLKTSNAVKCATNIKMLIFV